MEEFSGKQPTAILHRPLSIASSLEYPFDCIQLERHVIVELKTSVVDTTGLGRVLFSDELKWTRQNDSCRVFTWRESRESSFSLLHCNSNRQAISTGSTPSGSANIIWKNKDISAEIINHSKFDKREECAQKKYDACRRQIYRPISAKRNRRTTAQQVANQFLAASGKQISRKAVARRLRGGGLYARRPVVCVPLTRQHRTARLQWCREHHNWTEQDWACVLFSDESRFSLSSDCRRQLIWRESGTAYRPENIQEKDRYPTCSIMVWASIIINGRTRLHVVVNGNMTGQRYIDEVLLPHVRLFRGAVGDKFVFMDDNATCHRTLAAQDCLDSKGIHRLLWPARSPDLNPIENVWDALGRQVAGRNYPPTNKNTLIRALTEEWDKLPQQLLDNVVQSMMFSIGDEITLLNPFYGYLHFLEFPEELEPVGGALRGTPGQMTPRSRCMWRRIKASL
ncbi:transposable element Tcb2 transposase [Trichonephila clavipes]|nr:transposable element Tcb2 transposase [Trichonephila clavipes]